MRASSRCSKRPVFRRRFGELKPHPPSPFPDGLALPPAKTRARLQLTAKTTSVPTSPGSGRRGLHVLQAGERQPVIGHRHRQAARRRSSVRNPSFWPTNSRPSGNSEANGDEEDRHGQRHAQPGEHGREPGSTPALRVVAVPVLGRCGLDRSDRAG